MAERNKPPKKILGISEDALETLAETLYPDILELWNSEEGQKEFAEWKAAQQNKSNPQITPRLPKKTKAV